MENNTLTEQIKFLNDDRHLSDDSHTSGELQVHRLYPVFLLYCLHNRIMEG